MKYLQSFFLDFRTLALTLAKLKYLETILEEAQTYQADQTSPSYYKIPNGQ